MLMDPADFEQVAAELINRISGKMVMQPQYGMVVTESIYRLEGENVLIGIFANITKTKEIEARITRMRTETLETRNALSSSRCEWRRKLRASWEKPPARHGSCSGS